MTDKEKDSSNTSKILNKKKKREKKSLTEKEKDQNKIHELIQQLIQEEESAIECEPTIIIKPIYKYVSEKQQEWENSKKSGKNLLSDKTFAKSFRIIADFNYEFLIKILNGDQKIDIEEFSQYYQFYQFTLSVSQRKLIQEKLGDKCNSFPMIKNNYVPEYIKSTRQIFESICNSLIDITDYYGENFEKNLIDIFNKNHIYSQGLFKSFIPVRFGNNDLKINKLIFEIIDFFYKSSMVAKLSKEEIKLISKKVMIFQLFKPIFNKFYLFNDDTLFNTFDYLFNVLYVYFDAISDKRNLELFIKIITCCMPFEIEKAKNILPKLFNHVECDTIYIDGTDLRNYDFSKINELKPETKILFKERDIKVECKDINWNLTPVEFIYFLNNDKFMICFQFSKLTKINYLYINDNIEKSYKNLFKLIMKSKIMKKVMNIDENTKFIKYPFDDDSILEEIENYIYLVPLPADNYYGITDRNSFSIYINSFIKTTNFRTIFIDIDNIIKSKCHEIKHLYRIYLHIYNPDVQLKTPEIKASGLSTNGLTKNKKEYFKKMREIIDIIYKSKDISLVKKEKLDYGDILEYAIHGNKQNVFFIKNSLFCLSEKSWTLEIKKFMENYFDSCFDRELNFINNASNIFISSIISYFKIKTGLMVSNDADTSKRSSKESNDDDFDDNNNNDHYYFDKASHFRD